MAYHLDNLWERLERLESESGSWFPTLGLAMLAIAIEVRALRRECANKTANFPCKPYPEEKTDA